MTEDYKTTEECLEILCANAKEKPLSIKEVLEILEGKGRSLILIFLSLPFCQPIQIPGLSTPFGLIIAFLGLRIGLGRSTWLPKFLLAKHIPSDKIQKIAEVSLKVMGKLRFLIHPRLDWVCHHPAMRIINGLVICFLGIFLALPLPIPLSNLIAAWGIFLIGLGILEDDGVFVLIGHFIVVVTIVAFIWILLLFRPNIH